MITIYQIKLTNDQIDQANLFGFHSVEAVEAKAKMMFGARKWEPEFAKFYTPTYEIDTDNLEDAFTITNLWNEDWKVTRIRKGSSSSVGDIFVKDGTAYLVDNFGFVEMDNINLAA